MLSHRHFAAMPRSLSLAFKASPALIPCSTPAGADALRRLRPAKAGLRALRRLGSSVMAVAPTQEHKAGALRSWRPIWAVGPSALPCAGAAPPQRPPPKPGLTDRVASSQRVGWRAWRRLRTSCVPKSLT